nr:hypothetical protein [Bifidobacterium breve]
MEHQFEQVVAVFQEQVQQIIYPNGHHPQASQIRRFLMMEQKLVSKQIHHFTDMIIN